MMQHSEDLSRDEIQHLQLEQLKSLVTEIHPANRFWNRKWSQAGFQVSDLHSWEDFSQIPFTEKAELVNDHAESPPYGSNLTYRRNQYTRMHQTSGTTGQPMRWLDTNESWNWFMRCWKQIYRLAKVTSADRVCFPFSFGPFIGFWAAFDGACREGCLALPGGGLNSHARLKMILENEATVVCCTPTYALRLSEVAETEEISLAESSVKTLIVAGEPGGNIPATREKIERSWNADVIDHWGMTEIGSLAVEPIDRPGALEVLETECIAEILDPKSLQPVKPGEIGELVITNLGRQGSPLIRYRTGDLVKEESSNHSQNSNLLRLAGGILGRADDMVIIRGNNLFPSSLEAVLRRFAEIAEYRITVEKVREMNHLKLEIEPLEQIYGEDQGKAILQKVAEAIRETFNFGAEVLTVAPRSLPRFELKGKRFFIQESK